MERQAVELKVELVGIHSERRLRKCLYKVRGVKSVQVELSKKKVVVRGEAQERRVVRTLRRCGFRCQPWCNKTETLLDVFLGSKYQSFWMLGGGLF